MPGPSGTQPLIEADADAFVEALDRLESLGVNVRMVWVTTRSVGENRIQRETAIVTPKGALIAIRRAIDAFMRDHQMGGSI